MLISSYSYIFMYIFLKIFNKRDKRNFKYKDNYIYENKSMQHSELIGIYIASHFGLGPQSWVILCVC